MDFAFTFLGEYSILQERPMSRVIAMTLVVCLITGYQCQGQDAASQQPAAAAMVEAVDFEAVLRRPVKPEFVETPLSDVVEYFGKHFDINIQFDHKGLADGALIPLHQ